MVKQWKKNKMKIDKFDYIFINVCSFQDMILEKRDHYHFTIKSYPNLFLIPPKHCYILNTM